MFKNQARRYEMLQRVRDFGSKYQSLFPETSAAGRAFATVTEAVAAADRQSANRLVSAQAGKQARAIARKDVWERLCAIARSARRVSQPETDATGVFELPKRTSDRAVLDAARSFITEGEAVSHQWVPLGLPETSIADLRAAVEAFEKAVSGRRAGKTGRTEARQALTEALARGFDAVGELDVIVANTPQLDPVVRAVWQQSRRVGRASRVEAEEVETAPATLAVVAPAAPVPVAATASVAPAPPETDAAPAQ